MVNNELFTKLLWPTVLCTAIIIINNNIIIVYLGA